MSILNVEHLSHGFGDRAIFTDVSFRLLKGEHIGLIGANGEGKSTFMNIITGKLMPDEGKIEWAKNVRVGYLDQHTVLEKGMTIGSVLRSAFDFLFDMETQMVAESPNLYIANLPKEQQESKDFVRCICLDKETTSLSDDGKRNDQICQRSQNWIRMERSCESM